MPSKTTSKKTAPAKKTAASKTQARSQDSAKMDFTAAGVQTPAPDDLAALESERDDLQQPGQVSGKVAKQIDNDPGYDVDQLTHMAEYWGEEDRDEPGK